jgi:hypothetical protein
MINLLNGSAREGTNPSTPVQADENELRKFGSELSRESVRRVNRMRRTQHLNQDYTVKTR